ncbi:hypothetical protein ACVBE9_11395 [Eionea flava]
MSQNTPPPLRNYAQMVRVVRDDSMGKGSVGGDNNPFQASVPYQLGKAYGGAASSGAETRIRSLDEIGISSRSPNQLQAPDTQTNYDTRSSTVLYHQLSDDQQLYFDGVSPNKAPTRQDAMPGTKTRTYLGSTSSQAATQQITVRAASQGQPATSRSGLSGSELSGSGLSNSELNASKPSSNAATVRPQPTALQTHSLPVDSSFSHEKAAPKQTRLPFVTHHSLEGTAGNALGFSLTF